MSVRRRQAPADPQCLMWKVWSSHPMRRLRQLHGETVPTVQLTGVCHQCNG